MEDEDTVIVWCNEKGTFVDDVDYEMYVIMYTFKKDNIIFELEEYTNSDL